MTREPPAADGTDPRDTIFATGHLSRDITRQVGRASTVVLLLSLLRVALLFGGIAITARLIPPAEYGIFALAMPALAMAVSLSNFGLPQAIVQRAAISHAEVSTLFWANIGFAVAAAGVVFALAGPAVRLFAAPEVADVYRALASVVILSAVAGQFAAILQRRLQTHRLAINEVLAEATGLVVVIGAALAGFGYWALVAQQVALTAMLILLGAAITGWRPSGPHRARFGSVGDALSFGGFIAGIGLINTLIMQLPLLIVGARLGQAETGLLQRAIRIGNLPAQKLVQPLAGTFMSSLSRLQQDGDAMREMYVRLISRLNLLLLPAGVLLAAGAEPVTAILLGPDWMGAAPLIFWMSLEVFRAGANRGLRHMMVASGKSGILFRLSLLRLATVGLGLYAASPYGLVPVVATYMLIEAAVSLPMMVLSAIRHTPLTFGTFARASLGGIGFALALAAALLLVADPYLSTLPPLGHLAVLCGLIGMAYGGLIMVSPPLRRDVGNLLRQAREKIVRRG